MKFDNEHRFQITKSELIDVFSKAFSKMMSCEGDLFKTQVQERAFMHRFAFGLQCMLKAHSDDAGVWRLFIDVEYNRDGNDVKQIDNGKAWTAPDIIFHERKSGMFEGKDKYRNDVFCCEMKKNGRPSGVDSEKVKLFMAGKRYLFGVDFYQFACCDAKFDLYEKNGACQSYRFDRTKNVFVPIPKRRPLGGVNAE